MILEFMFIAPEIFFTYLWYTFVSVSIDINYKLSQIYFDMLFYLSKSS